MSARRDLITAFEYHSPEKIRAAIGAGAIADRASLISLTAMYSRSARFVACVQTMLNAGASFDDPLLEAIFLDDPARLTGVPLARTIDLACTFTSLRNVSPLHLCAEYNAVQCAKVLLDSGADVNAAAALDSEGFGGHTPIFHTVNNSGNYNRPMMELLAEAGADLSIQVRALFWGEGFEWETAIFDVTPISYAQCGLLRQFQRTEEDIYRVISYLRRKREGHSVRTNNIPNKYLLPK